MVAPTPVNPQIEQCPNGSSAVVLGSARTTGYFLCNFCFQALVVLLGIALAFM
jgi:hypothetical protein